MAKLRLMISEGHHSTMQLSTANWRSVQSPQSLRSLVATTDFCTGSESVGGHWSRPTHKRLGQNDSSWSSRGVQALKLRQLSEKSKIARPPYWGTESSKCNTLHYMCVCVYLQEDELEKSKTDLFGLNDGYLVKSPVSPKKNISLPHAK